MARPTAVKAPAAGVSAPGVEIHHRAREAAGDRVAAGEGRADIGGAQADQFLVGVDALAFLGGQRLRDRDGLDEADDRDQDADPIRLAHRGRRMMAW
jgi:hypothetical protein